MNYFNCKEDPVTIGITNYNGEITIKETIESIKKLDYINYVIIVVDDASTDNSVNIVRNNFPEIEIIHHVKNMGVSTVRNTIIKKSKTNLIFLIDNDITLDTQCLKILVHEKDKRQNAVVVSPRVLFYDGKRIQSDGTRLHYIGAAIHYNRNVPLESMKGEDDVMEVDTGSGGIMLLDKELAGKIDFFDEDFFFGWEDGEFMLRATLSGLRCYNVPRARVYHHYKVWGTKRAFYQMRNRWFVILINYSFGTIITILPMLILYEILLFLLMTKKGNINDYVKSWLSITKNFASILRKRKISQSRKIISDRVFLNSGNFTVDEGLMKNRIMLFLKDLINNSFNLYWNVILKLNLI